MRKICVVTGSRADYGHCYYLLKAVQQDRGLKLQLVVTAMHLSKKYGSTYKIIEADGFPIAARIDILGASSKQGVIEAISKGGRLFARTLSALKPDMVVLFGDRFETFAAATAAYVLGIPIVHLHGGERSEGVMDEGFRHAITKMAHVHFAAAEVYRRRIIRMGEQPGRVFNFGAPGQDMLHHMRFLNRAALAKELGLDLSGPAAVVTFHPETLQPDQAGAHIREVLAAIQDNGLTAVFTKANADPGGDGINAAIAAFCRKNPRRYKLFDNLGQLRYLSCLKNLDVVIGNSSSGLVEAPSLHTPTVNIGERQKGRAQAKSVITVACNRRAIAAAITKALSKSFRRRLKAAKNPYARFSDGKISRRIKEKLKNIPLQGLIQKSFYDGP